MPGVRGESCVAVIGGPGEVGDVSIGVMYPSKLDGSSVVSASDWRGGAVPCATYLHSFAIGNVDWESPGKGDACFAIQRFYSFWNTFVRLL